MNADAIADSTASKTVSVSRLFSAESCVIATTKSFFMVSPVPLRGPRTDGGRAPGQKKDVGAAHVILERRRRS